MSGFPNVCLALTQQLSTIQVMQFVVWRSTNQEIVSQHCHLATCAESTYDPDPWSCFNTAPIFVRASRSLLAHSVWPGCWSARHRKISRVVLLVVSSPRSHPTCPTHHLHCNKGKLGIVWFQILPVWASPTLFPGSSTLEREIELVHAERAWYFFSCGNPQR